MARYCKPSCYLYKKCVGWFGMEKIYKWIAYDGWNNEITRANTKKECMINARAKGYVPR